MDIANSSLVQISDALLASKLSSMELTEYAISQKQSDTYSNAYKSWMPEVGRSAARVADERYQAGDAAMPLRGIPVSVKDIYGLPGFPIFAGSHRELPDRWRRAGPIVECLQAQSSVFLGKTHTVEFAYGGLGVNNHWGTPANPWSRTEHRVPGGSSSGAGISICQGSAFVALGTDTAGSVRIPASYTGVVGLKTSANLWSTDGIVPLSPLLDTAGILVRTVEDAAYAFHALSHPGDTIDLHRQRLSDSQSLKPTQFRIGLPDSGILWECEDNIADICMEAVHALEKDGCSIISMAFPDAEAAVDMRNRGGTASVELIEFLQSELPEWLDNLDPIISERVKIGGNISAVEFLGRVRQIWQSRRSVLERFSECDVIASPTVPISPPTLEEVKSDEDYMRRNLLALRNTCVASFLDLCAITVPVGLDRNAMPVGLQFVAPAGQENLLLAIGQRLQSILPAPRLPGAS